MWSTTNIDKTYTDNIIEHVINILSVNNASCIALNYVHVHCTVLTQGQLLHYP